LNNTRNSIASGSLDHNVRMLCGMFYLLPAGRFHEAAREMSMAIAQESTEFILALTPALDFLVRREI